MKKKVNQLLISSMIIFSGVLISCEKNEETQAESEVQFVSIINGNPLLKSTMDNSLKDAKKIVLTIMNIDGRPTIYSNYEAKIYRMNDLFYSQKLILGTGNYNLTEFQLLDSTGRTIYVAPIIGSQEAQNVTVSLPIAFEIIKDAVSSVHVEVISTEGKTPEDFGLVSFPITEIKVINFMIALADKESDILLSGELSVNNNNYYHIQQLEAIANNMVTVISGFETYTLTIKKENYITYIHRFSTDSLKIFNGGGNNMPLVVELQKLKYVGSVIDIDGNKYKTVKIGSQWWMAENLKTSRYADGNPLVNGELVGDIAGDYITKYYFSKIVNDPAGSDDTTYADKFGCLYTWSAATNGTTSYGDSPIEVQGVCRSDWHLPSDYEWMALGEYLGGMSVAGGKLKDTGINYWTSPNEGATNETGFSALPGGARTQDGHFNVIGIYGLFWTSTVFSGNTVYSTRLSYFDESLSRDCYESKDRAFSVRCVKDE